MTVSAAFDENFIDQISEAPTTKVFEDQVFGMTLHHDTLDGVARELLEKTARGQKTRVAFVNAHCVNQMCRSTDYNLAVRSADYVLPDGSGIAIANIIHSGRKSTNLNGTDLAPILFEEAARRGLSVYFFGGLPGVAKTMCQRLADQYPGLRIAGFRQGYFHPDEEDRIIDEINERAPDIMLVAMGVPRQDVWLAQTHPRLNAKLVMGVGGLFDFLSERLPRAPKFLRALGLEWTFRLAQEPQRMWRRYVMGNPEFLTRALIFALRYSPDTNKSRVHASLKRLLDITAASVALVLTSPIFLITALAIRLEGPGPIIFHQERVGLNGKVFTLLKFRSMSADAEVKRAAIVGDNHHGSDGVTFKMSADPRVTRVGKLIRKYSIDELPQLWNVLNGEMSLVGPRPALPQEVARYTPFQRRRLEAKPGITCTWQISGRADIPFERQAQMDIDYIRNRSIWEDIRIILATPFAVLAAKGAY